MKRQLGESFYDLTGWRKLHPSGEHWIDRFAVRDIPGGRWNPPTRPFPRRVRNISQSCRFPVLRVASVLGTCSFSQAFRVLDGIFEVVVVRVSRKALDGRYSFLAPERGEEEGEYESRKKIVRQTAVSVHPSIAFVCVRIGSGIRWGRILYSSLQFKRATFPYRNFSY